MSANLVIIQLLHTQSDHADFLRLCWDKLTTEQKKQIFNFLFLAQQYKTFLTMLRIELQQEEGLIPWTHLLALFSEQKKINPQKIKSIIKPDLQSDEWGIFRVDIPEIAELWEKRKAQFVENHLAKKQKLLKELDFARNQGLKDKRIRLLDELKKLFPNDKDVAYAFHSEKEFHARHTVNRVSAKKKKSPKIKLTKSEFSKEEIKSLTQTAKKYIKKNSEYALDFIVAFAQMEQYDLALNLAASLKNKSAEILWAELTISIEAEQYARALSTIALLQQSIQTTEHSFSLLYNQALALYGLGQTFEALQIIKKILKIRPNYRSANSLLLEWESDL